MPLLSPPGKMTPPPDRSLASDENRCLTVVAGGERFGVPVCAVQSVMRVNTITPVPLSPWPVLGLVNLRGKVATAVSLRRRLRIREEPSHQGLLAIGMNYRDEDLALIVDDAGDVLFLDPKSRIPLPPHLDALTLSLIGAVYQIGMEILPILDVTRLFGFQHARM